jgi:hypothetical protein
MYPVACFMLFFLTYAMIVPIDEHLVAQAVCFSVIFVCLLLVVCKLIFEHL